MKIPSAFPRWSPRASDTAFAQGLRGRRGFSLVEVMLALGICTFAVVAIMGLLPLALDSAGEALTMARRAKVIQKVSNDLQQAQFSGLAAEIANRRWTFDVSGMETTDPVQIFFTVTGDQPRNLTLPGASSANPDLAAVVMRIATPAATNLVPLVIANRGE
jgi:uncharacterized protein (TIGR02598 family)